MIVSFFLLTEEWKIVTLTEVHITNVICVIVGDLGAKFSSTFFVWLIKLSSWGHARSLALKETPWILIYF